MKTFLSAILFLLLTAAMAQAGDTLLWIEAESAAVKEIHANPWFNNVAPDELSGGAWLGNFSEPKEPAGTAEYKVVIPEEGAYKFFARVNPRGTGVLYKVDSGAWTPIDFQKLEKEDKENAKKEGYVAKMTDVTNVAYDGVNDARYLAWIALPPATLSKGEHTIRFNLGGNDGEKRFSALDCFVLTTGPFTPDGKYRPGQAPAPYREFDPGKTWTFAPQRDEFSKEALWDHRALNEAVAGEHGFIKLSADGNSFVRGDGQPIRFWGGTDYVQRSAWEGGNKKMEELEHHAAFLAKRGVNVVRWHGDLPSGQEGSAITDVKADELDQAFRLVAGMKKQGIYTILSPYWATPTRLKTSWNVPSPGSDSAMGLVYFDPTMLSGYKAWVKALMTTPNPYTGICLKDDPSVAIIQLQNEDSMFFWTMQNVKGQQLMNLRKLYREFIKQKYGSLAKALETWQGYKADDDDLAADLPGMFIVWEFTTAARAKKGSAEGREARLADQFEFMCKVMHKFNADMVKYLRDELGCKQLVNAGNWRTADDGLMGDGERWSYTATDVIAKNHYYNGGFHRGINDGWQILAGNVYTNVSATLDPTQLPMNVRLVSGHPFIIPESLWVPPLLYQAEGPLMVAAQSSLTGLDTFYWFADGVEEWQPPLNIWTYATPMQLGQFPASALIFRKGYVKEAAPVVLEEKPLTDIWRRKTPLLQEGAAFDANRDTGFASSGVKAETSLDPLTFLTGPVVVNYGGDAAKTHVAAELPKLIDREHKIVRSVTGEIELDYGVGIYRLNAPKAQAAAGFLAKGGPQKLADVTIDAKNDYAAITVVALDDQPLQQSKKVLVQVGTVCRPEGWQIHPTQRQNEGRTYDAFRILSTGNSIWKIANTEATVTLRNAGLTKATALDANGMPTTQPIAAQSADGRLSVTLPSDALYVVLTAE